MIGGTDIIFDVCDEAAAMDLAIRVIRLAWDSAVYEDADTGQTFANYRQLELRDRPEILVYRDSRAQRAWKDFGPDPSVDGTMIHLIRRRGELTIGLDDQPNAATLSLVDVIGRSLRNDLFASTAVYKEAA